MGASEKSGTTLAAAQRDPTSAASAAYDAELAGHPRGAQGVLDQLDGRPGGIHACPPLAVQRMQGCFTAERGVKLRVVLGDTFNLDNAG